MIKTTFRCGVDSVDIAKFTQFYHRQQPEQLTTLFSAAELAYAQDEKDYLLKLAGRFAAKEACMKLFPAALYHKHLDFIDIEVANDNYGAPYVMHNEVLVEQMLKYSVESISLSLSHTDHHAIAMAVATVELKEHD